MKRFEGAITALVTPMRNGGIDEQGLVDLIEFQIAGGIHGIVPCGTTGESATLNFEEHKRVIELTVKTVKGRVPVIAGTGANSTLEAIELTESAKDSGADAVLSVVPYYNKPSQEGLFRHFKLSLMPSIFRWFSTMCRAGRSPTCCPRQWPGWRCCPMSSVSRRPAAI
jgi:4-hydroxy-tetrahydrodipicolinate synthase